nr:FecR domain-containing protein [Thiothrix fructosivorans]
MAQPSQTGAVGEVVFSIGRTQARMGTAETVGIKQGDQVFVNQTLSTSRGGHLHLRMSDGAFLSLRPDSVVTIAQYLVDVAVPSNNQIRLDVHKGSVRSVTGAAGQANKAGFRLNTPVAAIGIRGTDFTVFTDNQLSSVSVREGGVVVSPFTSACSRTALGACAGVQSVMLSAYNQQMVAEVVQQHASIIAKDEAQVVPDTINPAHPAEDKSLSNVQESSQNTGGDAAVKPSDTAGKSNGSTVASATTTKGTGTMESASGGVPTSTSTSKDAAAANTGSVAKTVTTTNGSTFTLVSSASTNSNSDAAVSVAPLTPITANVGPKASVTSELASRIIAENETGYTLKQIDTIANATVNPPTNTPPAVVDVKPTVPVATPEAQVFYWGRWNAYAENADQAILRDQVKNKQIFTNNSVHVLATTQKTQGVMPSPVLPATGNMEFVMDKGEAVVMVAEKVRAAEISNPKLAINFDTSRFNTSLDVNSTALTNGTAHLNAEGTLSRSSGLLASSVVGSNMNVSGALSSTGSQAGYVFEQPATGISGATSWQVQP